MASAAALGKILIVDDDENISELLKVNLGSEGYDVVTEAVALDVDVARLRDTDLVIADAMKQDYNGLDLLRDIKDNEPTAHVSVLLYSSYSSERMVIEALDEGADDYIQKPFSLRELMARIKAVMRRRKAPAAREARMICFRNLTIDPDSRTAKIDGTPLLLSKTEFAILMILVRNVDSFVSRIEIHRNVWNGSENSATNNERVVDTNISRLRKKLGEVGNCIVNRSGLGYMLAK